MGSCPYHAERQIYRVILGDPWPGAVSRVDKMFVVKVYCNLTVNFHHEPFIDPTKGLCKNYQEGGLKN